MKKSFFKLLKSFGFAFSGLKSAVRSENNFMYHFLGGISSILLGFYLKISTYHWAIIILLIGMVISAEMFNTAIEKLTDIVSPEYNVEAGQVKDISAGAVFLVSLTSVVAGLLIFCSYL
jgi:diacylglycerol kinase (ATP)